MQKKNDKLLDELRKELQNELQDESYDQLNNELFATDSELSAANRKYTALRKELNVLESKKESGVNAISSLQTDINSLNKRMEENEKVISDECKFYEDTYGLKVPDYSLPDTFEEILILSESEKVKADQQLARIISSKKFKNADEKNYYTTAGYQKLKDEIKGFEDDLFNANLTYGLLPVKKKEIHDLNENNPKDKQIIDKIISLFNVNDSTQNKALSDWKNIRDTYNQITEAEINHLVQKEEDEAKLNNLLQANLGILRKQLAISGEVDNENGILTEDTINLIKNEYDQKVKSANLGTETFPINSLESYFAAESKLLNDKPDTRIIDDVPPIMLDGDLLRRQIYIDNLSALKLEEPNKVNKMRELINDTLKKYHAENPQINVLAESLEDYENSTETYNALTKGAARIGHDILDFGYVTKDAFDLMPKSEIKNRAYTYNRLFNEKCTLESQLTEASFIQDAMNIKDIIKLKDNKHVYSALSSRIKKYAADYDAKSIDASDKTASNSAAIPLFGPDYNADKLINDHNKMRALEKIKNMSKDDVDSLKALREKIYKMKDLLRAEAEKNSEGFTLNQKQRQKEIREKIKAKETEMDALKLSHYYMYPEIDQNFSPTSKREYIEKILYDSREKAKLEKHTYQNKVSEFGKVTKNIENILSDFQTTKKKEHEAHYKNLKKQENQIAKENKSAFMHADSINDIISTIQKENIKRINSKIDYAIYKRNKVTYEEQIKVKNTILNDVTKNTLDWIKNDKKAILNNIAEVDNSVKLDLSNQIDKAQKNAEQAKTSAKVAGFTAQMIGNATDYYRKKLKIFSDALIKAPLIEAIAKREEKSDALNELRKTMTVMERNLSAVNEPMNLNEFESEVKAEQKIVMKENRITEIEKELAELNETIEDMKIEEIKRLKANDDFFNMHFGGVILTTRDQMRSASEAKLQCEVKAANGDQKKIDRANAEFNLRNEELDEEFENASNDFDDLNKKIDEIEKASDKLAKKLDSPTQARINTVFGIAESVFNFVGKKAGFIYKRPGADPVDLSKTLENLHNNLSNPTPSANTVDQLLTVGKDLYTKLQDINQSLHESYQEASRNHVDKNDLYHALVDENNRFMGICEKDTENKMGISLKNKRITYLNNSKELVENKLNNQLNHKRASQKIMQSEVDELVKEHIPVKQEMISNTSKGIDNIVNKTAKLEEQMDQVRDTKLEAFRSKCAKKGLTDKQISRIPLGFEIDPSLQLSGQELVGKLTNTKLKDNTKLEDVMKQIHKINMNGMGLINYIDPDNKYIGMLSANEEEQKKFKEELLNAAGKKLKEQFGQSIISVEGKDLLLHPVLLKGNQEFNAHSVSMVAGFNEVLLESAKMNVMMRSPEYLATKSKDELDKEKALQITLSKAVKQSRSRMSFASFLAEDKQTKERKSIFSKKEPVNEKQLTKEASKEMGHQMGC